MRARPTAAPRSRAQLLALVPDELPAGGQLAHACGRQRVEIDRQEANSTSTTGTPISIHWKNGTSTPSCTRMKPRPMTLGGVPTGVASPPIEAANDVISISAVA